MVKTYNTSLVEDSRRRLATKQGDHVSDQVSPILTPVVVIEPVTRFSEHAVQTTTGTMTILSGTAGKDIYITEAGVSFVKDATCNIASGAIQLGATLAGASKVLGSLAVLTTTGERDSITITFCPALKLDVNTIVSLTGTFTLGSLVRSAWVGGYFQEVVTP